MLYLSVCLCARGNSGEDEKVFTRFGPNISQFKHVNIDQKTKAKQESLNQGPQTFQFASPAITAKRFDQRLQPH